MTPLWAALLAGPALASEDEVLLRSAGLWTGPVAVRQAARHIVTPALGGWASSRTERGLALGAELSIWRRNVEAAFYQHKKTSLQGGPLVGWGVSTRLMAAEWVAGPALALELGKVDRHRFTEGSVGLRLRSAFEIRFVGPVTARASLGALARGLNRWDFDATGGLGVAF